MDFYNNFMPLPQEKITMVNGFNGANAIRLGVDSSKLVLDNSGDILWCITTDGAGYKTVKPYKLTPIDVPQTPEYKAFDDRLSRIEEQLGGLIRELTGNSSADSGK